jgi:hypothetical protein
MKKNEYLEKYSLSENASDSQIASIIWETHHENDMFYDLVELGECRGTDWTKFDRSEGGGSGYTDVEFVTHPEWAKSILALCHAWLIEDLIGSISDDEQ